MKAFLSGLERVKKLVGDVNGDLFQPVPHGPHTLLREVLLIADHNAYHIGQLIQLRERLGLKTPF